MEDWISPEKVPGLIESGLSNAQLSATSNTTLAALAISAPTLSAPTQPADDQVPLEVCRVLAATRPWLLFCSILGFVYTLLALIGGILNFARAGGAGDVAPVLVTAGLMSMVAAAVVGIGSGLLLAYGKQIGTLVMYKGQRDLSGVLEAARFFWQYVGIVLIVSLAAAIVFVVWFLAVAGRFGWANVEAQADASVIPGQRVICEESHAERFRPL
jgi:hypothetical protein